jgi:Protein of unknown function (DUF3551)
MRLTIFSLALIGIIPAMSVGAPKTASAQTLYNYKWCFVDASEGHTSCSFQTQEQCLATATGITGNCYPNWDYQPFPGGLPPPVVDTTARTESTYKYCFIRSADGTIVCYFDTLELCLQEASGITGNCYPNTNYRGPSAAAAPRGRVVATKKRSIDRNDR